MTADEIEQRLATMVEPIATEIGLLIYDIEVRPSSSETIVRVVLERQGASGPGTGITMAELTDVTRQLNYLLDVEDFIAFHYRLEVSSPGIERELTRAKHWQKNVGETVRAVLREPTEDGNIVLKGILESCDDLQATIACEDGVQRSVHLAIVKRARTLYDFGTGTSKPR